MRNGLPALAATMALAACSGGGGGSAGGGGGSVVVTPPTPTPSPSPTFTYATPFDFTRDGSVIAMVAEARLVSRYDAAAPTFYRFESGTVTLASYSIDNSLSYRQADQALTVSFNRDVSSFAAANLTPSDSRILAYNKSLPDPDLYDTIAIDRGLTPTSYARISRQERRVNARQPNEAAGYADIHRFYLFGSPTLNGDIPTSGVFVYEGTIGTSPAGIALNARIQVDAAARTITATIRPGTVDIVFTGSYAGNGLIGGIATADGSSSGRFTGLFFGPQAREIGLVFTLTGVDGKPLAGQVIAKRP